MCSLVMPDCLCSVDTCPTHSPLFVTNFNTAFQHQRQAKVVKLHADKHMTLYATGFPVNQCY